MLKTTVEQLEEEERNDDVKWRWPLEAEADKRKDDEMPIENTEKVVCEGWDEVEKSVETGGKFMKWADGQVQMVNICGVPKHVEKDWGDGKGPKARVQIQVFSPGVGMKMWDLAPATWGDLKDERAECKAPFADAVFAIKRMGSGSDTRYRFRYQKQLTATELAERNASSPPTAAGSEEDIPF